jgi:hypothetical protein
VRAGTLASCNVFDPEYEKAQAAKRIFSMICASDAVVEMSRLHLCCVNLVVLVLLVHKTKVRLPRTAFLFGYTLNASDPLNK